MNKSSLFFPKANFLPLLTLCILFVGGCTMLQPVNIAQESGRAALAKGDTVVVTTETGKTHTFKIVDITADGIHGKELSVPYSDIRLLQIKRINMQKTVLLTVGIIGLGAIAGNSGDNGGGY